MNAPSAQLLPWKGVPDGKEAADFSTAFPAIAANFARNDPSLDSGSMWGVTSALLGLLAFAFVAGAVAAEEVPGVDAAGVSVAPCEADGVGADGGDGGGSRGRLVHGEQVVGFGAGFAGLAACCVALFVAGGAGAGVAEPGEGPGAAVPVFPFDFHACAFGFVDADFGGLDGFGGELGVLLLGAAGLLFGNEADSFVAHVSIFADEGDSRDGWGNFCFRDGGRSRF